MEFIWNRYDPCIYCPPDYDDAKSKVLESVVKNLTIFSFVWGCFESFIDFVNPPHDRKGKITAICQYLKHHYEPTPLPMGYTELITELCDLRGKDKKAKPLKPIKLSEYIGTSGMGLKVVYEIRNCFAHGVLSIPEPDEWTECKVDYAKIINISSQIVLVGIQMVLSAYYKNEDVTIDYFREDKVPLHEILRRIHIDNDKLFDNNQTRIWDK